MKFLLAALLAVGLAACQTPRSFQTPGPNWLTYQGQLRYSDPETSMIGEVVVACLPPHHFQLDYAAGPGFPLLKLRLDQTSARAEGVMIRGRWQGAANAIPSKHRNLFALSEVFHQIAATRLGSGRRTFQSLTPGLWTAEVAAKGGRATAIDVRFAATGERFQFVFPPRAGN